MDTASDMDRSLDVAQAALLARHAPGTRVRRVGWSQGETQVLELGTGTVLLLVHGALGDGFAWVPILSSLARKHHLLVVDLPGHGLADSRSEEHTSELQSLRHLVCRLLLEK